MPLAEETEDAPDRFREGGLHVLRQRGHRQDRQQEVRAVQLSAVMCGWFNRSSPHGVARVYRHVHPAQSNRGARVPPWGKFCKTVELVYRNPLEEELCIWEFIQVHDQQDERVNTQLFAWRCLENGNVYIHENVPQGRVVRDRTHGGGHGARRQQYVFREFLWKVRLGWKPGPGHET